MKQLSDIKQQSGFTLIELVMVIVILGILAATALPKFVDLGKDARTSAIKAVEGSMRTANSIIYAKAAAVNALGAAGTVTINGQTINTAYGFAQTTDSTTGLAAVMDLSTDFTNDGATVISHSGAADSATCAVTYAPAGLNIAPTYTLTDATLSGC